MQDNVTNNNQNQPSDFDEQKRQKLMEVVNEYLSTHKKPWYFHQDKIKPSNNPYANDYDKAIYFPVTKWAPCSIPMPVFKYFNTFVVGRRALISAKWDFKAKAKWPGFINSFRMWGGSYSITSMWAFIGVFCFGLIIFIVFMAVAL